MNNEETNPFESLVLDFTKMIQGLKNAFDYAAKIMASEIKVSELEFEKGARRLGAMGWTLPMWAPVSFVSRLADNVSDPHEIDRIFVQAYTTNSQARFSEMMSELQSDEKLSRWNPLLKECELAYQKGWYLIAVPALLTVLEGFLASLCGEFHKRTGVIKIVSNRLRPGLLGLVFVSVHAFVGEVFADHDFSEERRPLIHRHWILHGRDDPQWTQADCLRLFQAIETIRHVEVSAGNGAT